MEVRVVIILLKDLPNKELDLIRNESLETPAQRLFFDSFRTFMSAQELLSDEDLRKITEQLSADKSPVLKSILTSMLEARSSNPKVLVPLSQTNINTALDAGKTLTPNDIADLCGVTVQLVRRECERGNIKAVKGKMNRWEIPESELQGDVCQRWISNKQDMWSKLESTKNVLHNEEEFLKRVKRTRTPKGT